MMIRCGTLGVISSCTTAMYTGHVMDTINIHHATQRESVSHCLPRPSYRLKGIKAMPSWEHCLMQQPVQRIFILGLAFVVTLGAALGAFLFVSLWPYFSIIGKAAAGVVMVGLGCSAALMLSFTYNKIASWNIKRRLVVFGEIGAYRERDGSWTHLSGIHQQMGLPAPNTVTIDSEPTVSDDDTVLELWRKGMSLRNIEKATGRKYHEIQKITSAAKNA